MGEDQSVNGIESPGRNGQPVLLTRIQDMRAVQPQCLLPSEWVLHGEHDRIRNVQNGEGAELACRSPSID